MRFPDPFNKHLGWVWGDGFEIETLMAIRAAKAGLKVAEVPSFEANRMNGVSNLNTFRDGARCLKTLIAEGIAPRTMSLIPDTAPSPLLATHGVHVVRDEVADVGPRIPDVVPSSLLGSRGVDAVHEETTDVGRRVSDELSEALQAAKSSEPARQAL